MEARQLSLGLGAFSIGLGLAELVAARPIAAALGQNNQTGVKTLRLFGAREIVAGLSLVTAPAHAARMWNRVAGDALDLAALGWVVAQAPRRRTTWGALSLVAAVSLVDLYALRRLGDKGTALPAKAGARHATTIEPEGMPLVHAPDVDPKITRSDP